MDERIARQKQVAGIIAGGGAFSLIPEPDSGLASTIVPIADGDDGAGAVTESSRAATAYAFARSTKSTSYCEAGIRMDYSAAVKAADTIGCLKESGPPKTLGQLKACLLAGGCIAFPETSHPTIQASRT
ncbi:hypothetical protein [Streptomyces sp. NPDC050528]|uniref:hypothetical protein n=1 Tax=Streptomyces sp. NPDC050528 TaxID=3365623 RepID=UPI00378DE352